MRVRYSFTYIVRPTPLATTSDYMSYRITSYDRFASDFCRKSEYSGGGTGGGGSPTFFQRGDPFPIIS